ncbi:hypothetical protein ACIQ2D_08435 [Lysinibacillus sp. NPDC097287]|uniref:hypothetical protein n=1 Tax=Lysinibacillus sp. NPDC097287 TaxID=3364144 RepID=UPI0037F9EF53
MSEFIIALILSIPLYTIFIWSYFNPEESLLLGERWKYKEEPDFSDDAIKSVKIRSTLGIVIVTLALIIWLILLLL